MKATVMNTFTLSDIRSWNPCYDPGRYLPDGWTGTALDILAVEECPASDKLWVVLRDECIDSVTIDAFGRWCALSVAHIWNMPDNVRQYLETGDVSLSDAAWSAARAAAWDAARDAASAAAWDAAWDAARAAAWDAARDAASAAAWDAAWDAQLSKLREMLEAL